MTSRIKSPRKPRVKTVKQRTNGKHKIDAASTMTTPMGGLGRVLRPQALFRWLGPQLAAITPTYIEQTMIGAMAGSSLQAWSLFDLMLKTWPELLACYQELIESVIRKKLVYEPYCEEDEKPTPSSLEKQKVVATALRRMQPDATRDDSDLEGTIRDVLDAWFRGVAVSEIIWQNVDDKQVGTITAPKSTFAVDPTNYGFATDGSLGLRSDKSKDAGVWPYSTTTLNPAPNQLQPFPEHKFLIAMHKASGGSPLGGALLRPLAWWWCAANFSSDWLLNLAQVFGLPFRFANYDTNAPQATIDAICNMLQNMGSNGWAAFPVGTTLEMITTGKEGSDHSPQGELLDRADRYARSLILGQTMTGNHGTTGKGGGQAFGTVEESVKSDRIDAAGKFAVTVINQQLVPSILMLNFGNTDEMPTLKYLEDEVADLTEAQRDKTLSDAGLEIGVDYLRKKYDIPEPAEGEDTIGGATAMPPGFGGQDPFGNQQDTENPDEMKAPNEESDVAAGDALGHEFHGNQWTTGNSDTANPKWNFINSKEIGQVTDARPGLWRKTPGDFTAASQAAAHYAKKQGVSMQVVPGNSFGHKVFHILPIHDDAIGKAGIFADEQNVAIVHPNGKVFQVKAVKKSINAGLQTKLLELNSIKDDAVFSRELLELVEST